MIAELLFFVVAGFDDLRKPPSNHQESGQPVKNSGIRIALHNSSLPTNSSCDFRRS